MSTRRIDDYTREIIEDETAMVTLTAGGQSFDFKDVVNLLKWLQEQLRSGMFQTAGVDIEIVQK